MRRLLVLLSTAVLMIGGVTLASPAEAATVKRKVSLAAPSPVTVGSTVTLTGKVTKSPKGTKVAIQRASGRKWATVKAVKTSKTGAFTWTFPAATPGASSYRASVAKKKLGKKALTAATSPTRSVTVTAKPAPPTPVPPTPTTTPTTPVPPAAGATTRVSTATIGTQGDADSYAPSSSADGRYIAYGSSASDLVPSDTNDEGDVFVRDTVARSTTRISIATDGTQGNDRSRAAAISADGRYIAFASAATNLVPRDTNSEVDVFVRDTVAGTTTLISTSTNGAQANYGSYPPSISADGRYIAFASAATNLVLGDTNSEVDVFVRDTVAGTTTRVGTDSTNYLSTDATETAISADGRYIAYGSRASDLVANDTNDEVDVFVRDTVAGTTTRISTATDGTQANNGSRGAAISADGRYIAFTSSATNLAPGSTNDQTDVFVRDTVAGTTTRISTATDGAIADRGAYAPSISADGRYIAFLSYATNLVPGDTNDQTDVFVRDTIAGTTTRINTATNGTQADGSSEFSPSISADGRYVAFGSEATNLVIGDTNKTDDVFARGPLF